MIGEITIVTEPNEHQCLKCQQPIKAVTSHAYNKAYNERFHLRCLMNMVEQNEELEEESSLNENS